MADVNTEINCTVNGQPRTLHAYPMERLLDVLREQLHLTGTKEGCGEGECGACSVVVDGRIVHFLTNDIERPDVGPIYNSFVMNYTWFEDTINLSGLRTGRLTIALVCIGAPAVDRYFPTNLGEVVLGR